MHRVVVLLRIGREIIIASEQGLILAKAEAEIKAKASLGLLVLCLRHLLGKLKGLGGVAVEVDRLG